MSSQSAPNSRRILWVLRHAEREDNINPKWQTKANPHGLKSDNSPLSARGHKQARELAARFANTPIDHVFASPFERTVETATFLVADRGIPIKLEPGICEGLYMCEDPPGFEEARELKKRFPLIDETYNPVYKKPMPEEGFGDDACIGRLRKTLDEIFKRYKDATSIVLVSHGSPIGAIHEVLTGEWNYVGQATVSKFVETAPGSGQFKQEFTSDASHLSDKNNLRAY